MTSISRTALPEFVIETRRTSASSSAETSTSMSRRQRSVAARELGAILVERDIIVVGLGAARLKSRRPDVAAVDVAQKDVGAPVVAGGVLAPACDRQIAPAAVTRAGGGEHHGVAAVREQLRGRASRRARWSAAGRRAARSRDLVAADFASAAQGRRDRDVARRALLQQQLRRLDDRLGVEPRPHRAVRAARRRWRRSSCPDDAP